jgi:3-deoxy-D-arabino-heptulosonate 7-phosphate (DAHP) synthase
MFDKSTIILIVASLTAVMSLTSFILLLVFRHTQKVCSVKNQEEFLARLDSVKDEITKAVIHKIENSDKTIVEKFDIVKTQILEIIAKNDANLTVLQDVLCKEIDVVLKEIKAPLEIE